jgi:hypothetical protein
LRLKTISVLYVFGLFQPEGVCQSPFFSVRPRGTTEKPWKFAPVVVFQKPAWRNCKTRVQQVAWIAAPASRLCPAAGADEIRFRNPLVYQRTTDNEQPTIFNLPAVGFYVRGP